MLEASTKASLSKQKQKDFARSPFLLQKDIYFLPHNRNKCVRGRTVAQNIIENNRLLSKAIERCRFPSIVIDYRRKQSKIVESCRKINFFYLFRKNSPTKKQHTVDYRRKMSFIVENNRIQSNSVYFCRKQSKVVEKKLTFCVKTAGRQLRRRRRTARRQGTKLP